MVAVKVIVLAALVHFVGCAIETNIRDEVACVLNEMISHTAGFANSPLKQVSTTNELSWGGATINSISADLSNLQITGSPQVTLAEAEQPNEESNRATAIAYNILWNQLIATGEVVTTTIDSYGTAWDVKLQVENIHIAGVWNTVERENSLTLKADVDNAKLDITGTQVPGNTMAGEVADWLEIEIVKEVEDSINNELTIETLINICLDVFS